MQVEALLAHFLPFRKTSPSNFHVLCLYRCILANKCSFVPQWKCTGLPFLFYRQEIGLCCCVIMELHLKFRTYFFSSAAQPVRSVLTWWNHYFDRKEEYTSLALRLVLLSSLPWCSSSRNRKLSCYFSGDIILGRISSEEWQKPIYNEILDPWPTIAHYTYTGILQLFLYMGVCFFCVALELVL